ncbi:sporulation-control protein [Salirhabdus euzebyi]|uniref:Sporulation-control protein n=1 Tax=Salirhabdus euzebyi TaxID=394506 RepID=A0A841Q8N8_9BACI|nr:sporulation protein [Salirhabdus euzebyi]MBB6454770.1 sporulation-control protein [Salirhabdus euzebyi]
MLKKWLASVGIGNAKVDTQLENDHLLPGGEVKGKVFVKGGSTEQQVDRIQLFVMTEAVREKDDRKVYEKVVIDSFTIGDSFVIGGGEEKSLNFNFQLPIHTPPTLGRTKVWIQTGLDVPNAIDPNDRDYVKVDPHSSVQVVLEALTNHLGFQLRKVEMEYSKRYRYVQEFEFLPSTEFRRDLDELEAMFFVKPNGLELVLQVDRRAKGLGGLFAEALDMDESFVRVSFSNEELAAGSKPIANHLKQTIKQFS